MNIRLYMTNGTTIVVSVNTLNDIDQLREVYDFAYHQTMMSDNDECINYWDGKEWRSKHLSD